MSLDLHRALADSRRNPVVVANMRRHLRRLREEVAALKAEVARLKSDAHAAVERLLLATKERRAAEAEAQRLAVLAREACDALDHAHECSSVLDDDGQRTGCDCFLGALRASIPTPDPAAFVEAVDEFGDACYELGDADHDDTRLASIRDRRYAARAALLALGGVR